MIVWSRPFIENVPTPRRRIRRPVRNCPPRLPHRAPPRNRTEPQAQAVTATQSREQTSPATTARWRPVPDTSPAVRGETQGPVLHHKPGVSPRTGATAPPLPLPHSGLAAERRRAPEEIDPWWCPTRPITWQRAYPVARSWRLDSDGRVDRARLPTDTVFEGEQLGRWAAAQRLPRVGVLEPVDAEVLPGREGAVQRGAGPAVGATVQVPAARFCSPLSRSAVSPVRRNSIQVVGAGEVMPGQWANWRMSPVSSMTRPPHPRLGEPDSGCACRDGQRAPNSARTRAGGHRAARGRKADTARADRTGAPTLSATSTPAGRSPTCGSER